MLYFQSGETAAHVAARYGHMLVLEYLVSAGMDMNIQDNVRYLPEAFFTFLFIYYYHFKSAVTTCATVSHVIYANIHKAIVR